MRFSVTCNKPPCSSPHKHRLVPLSVYIDCWSILLTACKPIGFETHKMVLRCAWGQCNTDVRYPDREPGVKLIRFPGPRREKEKCLRWIKACGRPHEQLNITKIDTNKAVCSKHFVGGNGPTEEFPDPVPADPYSKPPRPLRKKKKTVSHSTSLQQLDLDTDTLHSGPSCQPLQELDLQHSTLENRGPQEESGHKSCATQTDERWISSIDVLALAAENKHLQQKVIKLWEQLSDKDAEISFLKQEALGKMAFGIKKITCLEAKMKDLFKFYTGISYLRFVTLLTLLVPSGTLKYSHKGGVRKDAKDMPLSDALFMTLCRLRHNFKLKDLAVRFNLQETSAGLVFRCWTDLMYKTLSNIAIWPSREVVIENMPLEYRKDFPRSLIIIDGTELRTERPSALGIQSQMYSDYKSSNTLKGLIGCDPRGSILFVSALFTGSISDKAITQQSGFYEFLEDLKKAGYICDGDAVMADKGFEIHEELQKLGLLLNIPPKASSASQMCPADAALTQKIAKHRVHIERVIRKIKLFKIVSDRIPTTLFPHINKIWSNCAFLTLFQDVFVKDKQPKN